VRAGGEGDVTKTHVLWKGRVRGRIGTPVYYEGRIYSVGGGIANCIDAATGKEVYQARVKRSGGDAAGDNAPDRGPRAGALQEAASPQATAQNDAPPPGGPRGRGPRGRGGFGGGGFGGFGGGMGGFGGQDYASPVVADGKLYYLTRSGEMIVIKLSDKFEQLASNRFADDTGDYSATPAVVDGQLFIRSSANLFCVGAEK
jgi:outer membrane protein assembly factor BamB